MPLYDILLEPEYIDCQTMRKHQAHVLRPRSMPGLLRFASRFHLNHENNFMIFSPPPRSRTYFIGEGGGGGRGGGGGGGVVHIRQI